MPQVDYGGLEQKQCPHGGIHATWITKEFTDIAVCQMANEHIENAIAALRRGDPQEGFKPAEARLWIDVLENERSRRLRNKVGRAGRRA